MFYFSHIRKNAVDDVCKDICELEIQHQVCLWVLVSVCVGINIEPMFVKLNTNISAIPGSL